MNVRVWIDRGLGLQVVKRVPKFSTVGELKRKLAADDVLGQCSADDLVLLASGPPRRPLHNRDILTELMRELEFGAGDGQAEEAAGPPPPAGSWLYSGKYRYHISEGDGGQLYFREILSSGKQVSGAIRPRGAWHEAELRFDDGAVSGTMRFHYLEDEGIVQSNFKNASKPDWGADMTAQKATPASWEHKEPEPEWFEVVLSKVLIKRSPSKDESSWGFVFQGTKIQVSAARAVDIRGWEWVELTPAELHRSFPETAQRPSARGFALIDGAGLNLGLLLRGPLPREEWPEPLEAETEAAAAAEDPDRKCVLPLLPAVPEQVLEIARSFVTRGWAHVGSVGVAPAVLRQVRPELERLDWEMTRAQTKGDEFSYRTDKKLFFDTSSERVRGDIPGLNQLVDTLQGFVAQLGKLLERSPLRLRLSGRCRPMLASYDPGGRYLPHVDNGDGDGRVLTLVYYLNEVWREVDGGALRVYPDTERRAVSYGISADAEFAEFLPAEDSMALFRADWMVHEVRPADRKRVALTLWFLGDLGCG